jgi:hypothetical protein
MKRITLLQTSDIKNKKQIADLFTLLNTDQDASLKAYLLDTAGIKKNKPALEIHQYATRWFETIVDAGCRHIGDVVDVLLAGAEIIVLRPSIWDEPDSLTIRDISESKIYVWFDLIDQKTNANKKQLFNEADGIVLYADQVPKPMPFEVRDRIGSLVETYSAERIVVFDSMDTHGKEWDIFGLNTRIFNADKVADTHE